MDIIRVVLESNMLYLRALPLCDEEVPHSCNSSRLDSNNTWETTSCACVYDETGVAVWVSGGCSHASGCSKVAEPR
jgi:hypothetical protein